MSSLGARGYQGFVQIIPRLTMAFGLIVSLHPIWGIVEALTYC
jgi:hypothetical protein